MRKIFTYVTIFSIISIISCQQQMNEINWLSGIPENPPDNGKMMMIDFYGKTSSPCMKLFKVTFTDSAVIDYAAKNLNCYKIEAWSDENADYRKKFNIFSVPTILFLDEEGKEIERLTQFMPPEKFLYQVERIARGEDTYLSLLKQVDENPLDLDATIKLAEKVARMELRGMERSQDLWMRVIDLAANGTYERNYGKMNYFAGIMWQSENPEQLISFLDSLPDYPFVAEGMKWVLEFYQYRKDTLAEAKYYAYGVERILQSQEKFSEIDIPKMINEYSWRMTLIGQNLNDALDKIQYAIDKLPPDEEAYWRAAIMDTEAEIHWLLGNTTKALEIIEECIKLMPDDSYYEGQKEKFAKTAGVEV